MHYIVRPNYLPALFYMHANLQDAKKDEACRKAYRYLASLHEVSNEIW